MRYDFLKMAGSCRNGDERDKGRKSHAVQRNSARAICGAQPGPHSVGWSSYLDDKVTCPRCATKLAKLTAEAA